MTNKHSGFYMTNVKSILFLYNLQIHSFTLISRDPAYLAAASRGVYDGITAGDPKGVWLMQGWLFQDTSFWGPSEIKALLHGVPIVRKIFISTCY